MTYIDTFWVVGADLQDHSIDGLIGGDVLRMGYLPIMSEIIQITSKIEKFRDDCDWKQFHNHKDVALSLVTALKVRHSKYNKL